jgi:hypothetical protein
MAPDVFSRRLTAPPLAVPKLLTRKSNVLSLCAAVATALVVAFPLAQGIGAVSYNAAPTQQVNRAAKGDLLVGPRAAGRKVPVEPVKNPARPVREQSDKRMLMEGCESSFSPVTVPSMAHIAGRCVG